MLIQGEYVRHFSWKKGEVFNIFLLSHPKYFRFNFVHDRFLREDGKVLCCCVSDADIHQVGEKGMSRGKTTSRSITYLSIRLFLLIHYKHRVFVIESFSPHRSIETLDHEPDPLSDSLAPGYN